MTIRGMMFRTALAALVCAAALNPPPGEPANDPERWARTTVVLFCGIWLCCEIVGRSK